MLSYIISVILVAISVFLFLINNKKTIEISGGNNIETMDFPYKKHSYTDAQISTMMDNLRNYKPSFTQDKSYRINLVHKTIPGFDTRYYTEYRGTGVLPFEPNTSKNLSIVDALPDMYNSADVVGDIFNEEPRIKTVGYGEKYSPYQLWTDKSLHYLWMPNLKKRVKEGNTPTAYDYREAIYDTVTEARQEKASIYVSLYSLKNNCNVLDMSSAYGDRLIPAILKNITYTGVDPWSDLFAGYDKIFKYLKVSDDKFNMIRAASEDVILDIKPNMVIMSPAPYNLEKYGDYSDKNRNGQAYNTYDTYDKWLINYLFATIMKAYRLLEDTGFLCIKILDRLKGKSHIRSGIQSDNLEIKYTEITLLYCEAIGFKYVGTIGNVGSSGSVVPWWMFEKVKSTDRTISAIELLSKYYKNIYDRIYQQLVIINPTKLVTVRTKKFIHELYDIDCNMFSMPAPTLVSEYVRFNVMKDVIKLLCAKFEVPYDKMETFIGRYFNVQSINNKLSVDPVFPVNGNMLDQLTENLKYEYKLDEGDTFKTLTTSEFFLTDKRYIGIEELFHGAIIQTNIMINRDDISDTKIDISYGNVIKFKYRDMSMSISKSQCELLKSKYDGKSFERHVCILLMRYKILGWDIHQWTRVGKYEALKSITGCDFEAFAAPFNSYSRYYFSIFPDIDKYFGSLGSYFMSNIHKGVFNANPVSEAIFVDKALQSISNIYNKSTDTELTFIIGLLTHKGDLDNITDKNIMPWYLMHGKVGYIKNIMKLKQSQFAFVINNEKFKSIDPITGITKVSPLVSICVVVSNMHQSFDKFLPMMR